MIWSSWREPVPAILNLPGPATFAPSTYSLAVFYGVAAFTHSTNWSSAIIFTGVSSFQLKGTPVASGVVKRFDSVMMILCGSPLAPFTSRKPSAPAPPALLMTTIDCFISPCLAMIPWIVRAIWSAPPPVPAGTMNSTVLVGSQACAANGAASAPAIMANAVAQEYAALMTSSSVNGVFRPSACNYDTRAAAAPRQRDHYFDISAGRCVADAASWRLASHLPSATTIATPTPPARSSRLR